MGESTHDTIDDHPMYANDPNRRPGGAYWHRDLPEYDKIRADILEDMAVMLWEEQVYLRDGTEPQGTGIPRSARLENIRSDVIKYRSYTMKDVRPRGLWDQPIEP